MKPVGQNSFERIKVPGWSKDRPVDLFVPPQEGEKERPLVVALHGYTQNSDTFLKMTSPEGDIEGPGSLQDLARREGFILAVPNGTLEPESPVAEGRSWNAGDGGPGLRPMLGEAQKQGVDDVKYLSDTIAAISKEHKVDPKRIYVCGFSNGAAMAHRVAMELSGQIAAVAAVGGADHFTTSSTEEAQRPTPVLQIHGTADPIWPYAGAFPTFFEGGLVSAPFTVSSWVNRNELSPFPKVESDFFSTRQNYSRSDGLGDVNFVTVHGGGHSWPGGEIRPINRGPTVTAVKSNEIIWDFFKKHPL